MNDAFAICDSEGVRLNLVGVAGLCRRRLLHRLRELPGCVGFHLCGAYLRNENRKRALRDATEKPDVEVLQFITNANQEAQAWMRDVR